MVVALVRKHVETMRPPRALWVPYELGRPFGAPNNRELQTRTLAAALALLDRDISEPYIADFEYSQDKTPMTEAWQFLSTLDCRGPVEEATSLLPLWQQTTTKNGRTAVGLSGLTPQQAIEYIHRYHSQQPMPNPRGMAAVSRARFAIDDIKAFYTEAAMTQPGQPSSTQLRTWLWQHTLAGKMILEFQDQAVANDDENLNKIASSLVPAEFTYSWLRQQND